MKGTLEADTRPQLSHPSQSERDLADTGILGSVIGAGGRIFRPLLCLASLGNRF